jgi:hypothetical protein
MVMIAASAGATGIEPVSSEPAIVASEGAWQPTPIITQPYNPYAGSGSLDDIVGDTLIFSMTWRDQLGTSSMNRTIGYAVTDEYPYGVVHLTWQEHIEQGANRTTQYAKIIMDEDDTMTLDRWGGYIVGDVGGGYPVMDVERQDGTAYICLHNQRGELWMAALYRRNPYVANLWSPYWTEPYGDTGMNSWPKMSVGYDGDGDLYSHIIGWTGEGTTETFYSRAIRNPADGTWSDATPSGEGQMIVEDWSNVFEGVTAANDNGDVSIITLSSRQYMGREDNGYYDDLRLGQSCNDVLLFNSSDGGATWDFNNYINITNFIDPTPIDGPLPEDTTEANGDTFRVRSDCNLVVDEDGVRHALFTTVIVDYWRSTGYVSRNNRFWYWNSQDELFTQIVDATYWNGAIEGSWQTFTNQATMSIDPETGYIWAAWSQYGGPGEFIMDGEDIVPLDASTLHYGLGDIMVAVSPDHGHRWTKAVNITNTRDMSEATALAGGLQPYEVRSEIHPSMALNCDGDYLHLIYLLDRDGGRNFTWEEGAITQNEMVYHRVSKQQLIEIMYEQAEWVPNYPMHKDSTQFYEDPAEWEWNGLQDEIISVEERPDLGLLPGEMQLEQNYPNPFNPTTQVAFSLDRAGLVKLAVYDVLGRQVAVLLQRQMERGRHQVHFDASQLPSGMYFARLSSGSASNSIKMILMK